MSAAHIRTLKARKAEAFKAATAINAITDRDLSAEEQKALDGHMASIEALNRQIATAEALANEAAGMDAAGGVTLPAGATITVQENLEKDAKRGFATFGQFAQSVINANRDGGAMDRRLAIGAAAPGAAANEGAGADGGFVIPPAFSGELWKLSLEDDSLIPLTANRPVSGNSMVFPKTEQTPWGTNGVRAYWQSEAGAGTATKPVLGAQVMRLHKLMALIPMTDELIADAPAMQAEVQDLATQSLRWKTNEAILFGNGNGQPLGAFNGGALVTQAKESGQATLTLDKMNIAKMAARMLDVNAIRSQVWVMNHDALPYLWTLNSNNQLLYLPYGAGNGAFQNSPSGTLLGRNVIATQHMPSFSTAGDIALVDLSYYRTITKAAGIEVATSMHLYFDADAMALRLTFRIDGSPKLAAPVTPAKGSTTLSPIVNLQAR